MSHQIDIAALRREYALSGLRRADLAADPLPQFHTWFAQACAAELLEPSAMTLATVDAGGQPSARTVLLKGADERGFLFFTNYESRKGRELKANPRAALVLLWSPMERQICVRGEVSRVDREESKRYFHSRPRGSQLGAWVSQQSSTVSDRQELEDELVRLEERFRDREVELPPFWGGYVLRPATIEFWQGRPNRLHDRFLYTRQADGTWRIDRLSP